MMSYPHDGHMTGESSVGLPYSKACGTWHMMILVLEIVPM